MGDFSGADKKVLIVLFVIHLGKVVYLGEQVESRWVLDSRTLRLLQLTAEFFGDQRQQAFLVGGSLRNILLGEPCDDWDIVTTGDAPTLARQLADKLGGFYAYLHEKACRVVVPALTMPKDVGERLRGTQSQ